MHGLEACINVTDYEKKAVWDILTEEVNNKDHVGSMSSLRNTINAIVLRARYNSQRHYEVYSVQVDDGITKDDIVDMFDSNPQSMAELIRERGNKIYSDRIEKQRQVIT
jgi:hypothetical protein